MTEVNTEDIGLVIKVNGSEIVVEINKGGGCKSCSMHGLCGTNNKPVILTFKTAESFKEGDRVYVSVAGSTRILSALLVFILPLICLFGFFLLGRMFTNEPMSVLIGFIGLVFGFIIIRFIDKKIGKHINFQLGGKCEDLPE